MVTLARPRLSSKVTKARNNAVIQETRGLSKPTTRDKLRTPLQSHLLPVSSAKATRFCLRTKFSLSTTSSQVVKAQPIRTTMAIRLTSATQCMVEAKRSRLW